MCIFVSAKTNNMKMFTKISTVSTIRNPKTNEVAQIVKFKKDGTAREFFTVEIDGKRLVSTMFARMYDAEKMAKTYLNRVK